MQRLNCLLGNFCALLVLGLTCTQPLAKLGGYFLACEDFEVSVRPFIPRLRFFFFFPSEDYLAHIDSAFHARISRQWLSELRRLWPIVP